MIIERTANHKSLVMTAQGFILRELRVASWITKELEATLLIGQGCNVDDCLLGLITSHGWSRCVTAPSVVFPFFFF
jgi:hypothetical protein